MNHQRVKSYLKNKLPSKVYKLLYTVFYIPKRFINYFHRYWLGMQYVRFFQENKGQRIILLIGVHEYGNLGDHAIGIAERRLLEQYFPEHIIIEISTNNFCPVAAKFATVHCDKLVVAVHGGGFLGNLWLSEERMFRLVLRTFPRNRVVVLPQTIFFQKDKRRCSQMKASIKAYNNHPDLHIFIRDESFNFIKKKIMSPEFNNLYTVPDIVLSLNYSKSEIKRERVVFCLRRDKERVIDKDIFPHIQKCVYEMGIECCLTDTVLDYSVLPQFRQYAVENLLNSFCNALVVITDRLHGMLFAAITGTPCIALDNISGKVGGVYRMWLKNLPWINFVENIDEITSVKISNLISHREIIYNPSQFQVYWEQIIRIINGGFDD